MTIQQNIEMFIQYVRRSKRKITKYVIMAAIIPILIFLGGNYYFLYRYYQSIITSYYTSLLHELYSFQDKLISKQSYLNDITSIARRLKTHKGVVQVWITDRYGKCMYHTDKIMRETYMGRQLPVEYYTNIQRIWEFSSGFPVIVKAPTEKKFIMRWSIPLYTFGHKEPDFILGIDIKRFIYLPPRFDFLSLWGGIWLIISFILLFFPVWVLVRINFENIASRARILGGAIVLEKKSAAEENVREIFEEKVEEKVEERVEEKESGKLPSEQKTVREQERVVKRKSAHAKKEQQKEENILAELEKKEQENPRIQLIEKKQMLFRKERLELPGINAQSLVFHSRNTLGDYVFYHNAEDTHYFASFNLPDMEIDQGVQLLSELYGMMKKNLSEKPHVKDAAQYSNSYCLDKEIRIDFFLVALHENYIEYTSFGAGYALYLKNGEESAKDFSLKLPQLGVLKNDEFLNTEVYAEIRFNTDDIFIVLPANYSSIVIDDMPLDTFVRKVMQTKQPQGMEEIGNEIEKSITAVRRKQKDFPETGLVLVSFV